MMSLPTSAPNNTAPRPSRHPFDFKRPDSDAGSEEQDSEGSNPTLYPIKSESLSTSITNDTTPLPQFRPLSSSQNFTVPPTAAEAEWIQCVQDWDAIERMLVFTTICQLTIFWFTMAETISMQTAINCTLILLSSWTLCWFQPVWYDHSEETILWVSVASLGLLLVAAHLLSGPGFSHAAAKIWSFLLLRSGNETGETEG
jgi:hypothetical protein